MLNENSFYIDLVSNASMDIYPENTVSRFTNKLSTPLELNGLWKCAINEIFHPLNFIPNKRKVPFQMIGIISGRVELYDKNIYEFEYTETDKIESLLKDLNAAMTKFARKDEFIPPNFSLNEKKKVVLTAGEKKHFGEGLQPLMIYPNIMDQDIYTLLGFDQTKYLKNSLKLEKGKKNTLTASYLPDLEVRSNLLLIYSDLVTPHHVGDSYSELLRVVPLSKGSYESVGHLSFSNPYYYQIKKSRVESISILLCDETGQQIKFKSGRVHISLHFTKVL